MFFIGRTHGQLKTKVRNLTKPKNERRKNYTPTLLGIVRLHALHHQTRQNAIGPLMRHGIELPIQLAHGYRLGIEAVGVHRLEVAAGRRHLALERGHGRPQRLVALGLAGAGGADEHEAVAHHRRLVQLHALDEEAGDVLEGVLGAGEAQRRLQHLVVDGLLLGLREEVGHDAVEELEVVLQELGHVDVADRSQADQFLGGAKCKRDLVFLANLIFCRIYLSRALRNKNQENLFWEDFMVFSLYMVYTLYIVYNSYIPYGINLYIVYTLYMVYTLYIPYSI